MVKVFLSNITIIVKTASTFSPPLAGNMEAVKKKIFKKRKEEENKDGGGSFARKKVTAEINECVH